jgi:DNA-binding beta-propeller fold protein YncE
MVEVRGIESGMKRCAYFATVVATLLCSISQAQTTRHNSSSLAACDLDRDFHSTSESCDEFALSSGFGTPALIPVRPFLPKEQPTFSQAKSVTGYRLTKKFSIPGEAGWDYVSIDSEARRLYVSHGTQLEVLDADSGKIVGKIADTPGVHGAAIAPEFRRGFSSNGRDKSVTIFDTKTLATIGKVPLESGTDFILYDPFSKRVFPINEKITVIDAESGKVAGTVDLGGDPEAAVTDGKGTLYINIADRKAVAVVDPKALVVMKTYPIENCTSPHSLSYDRTTQRLFVGCKDGFAALDATTGKVVGRSLMCAGVDAGGFDPEKKWIFESCGEGVISVIRETTPDYYELIETIPTQLFARTMVFDPKTKNIYLLTAEFETVPNADPAKSPVRKMRAGSFCVLVVGR